MRKPFSLIIVLFVLVGSVNAQLLYQVEDSAVGEQDFLAEWQESLFNFLLGPDDDDDGDGLTNFEEQYVYFTYPDNVDSDDDGLEDGDEVYIYGTNPTYRDGDDADLLPDGWDTDRDELGDGAEVLFYLTDPTKNSTDGDPYDDKQELTGTSKNGDMPDYVHAPGNNVFVAAYPVIEIVVDDNISIEEIPVITFGTETWEEGTVGYAVTNTTGSSITVGTTTGHTTGGWIDVNNAEEDSIQKGAYQKDLSSAETKNWTGYSQGKQTEIEVGGEVNASIGITGPAVSAKVYGSVKETITTGNYGDEYKGTVNSKEQGSSVVSEKIRKTSVSNGTKNESSFSTTVTRTNYSETSVTNSNSIATGEKWKNSITIDTNNAGNLRFRFWIKNTGSDVADEINGVCSFNCVNGVNDSWQIKILP